MNKKFLDLGSQPLANNYLNKFKKKQIKRRIIHFLPIVWTASDGLCALAPPADVSSAYVTCCSVAVGRLTRIVSSMLFVFPLPEKRKKRRKKRKKKEKKRKNKSERTDVHTRKLNKK